MASYLFHLYTLGEPDPIAEIVDANDDEDAQALAEMRLLLTARFTSVAVTRDGDDVITLTRDSLLPKQ